MSEAVTITNRDGKKIAVLVDQPEGNARGLVFVLHGLGGRKELEHIAAMKDAAIGEGLVALRFDMRDTYGESEGKYEDATVTSYYEDLEDVIAWAAGRSWFRKPFFLTGHSMGGITVGLYAENHPADVAGVAPVSAVVSGELSLLHHMTTDYESFKQWQESGWRETPSRSKPGLIKRLKWTEMEDRLRYSLVDKVANLTMPVLLVVGDEDASTPWQHQQLLYELIPGHAKKLRVIAGCDHNFFKDEEKAELRRELAEWFRQIINGWK